MADTRTKPSNDPQRPPKGPGSGTPPLPPVILVQPEIIAALDRIATAFEQTAAALTARPVDAGDVAIPDVADGVPRTWAQTAAAQRAAAQRAAAEADGVCRAEVYRLGDPVPYLCNRLPGHPAAEHDPGHVAKVARKILACSTCTQLGRATTGMVCQTCGTDYAQEV